MQMTFKIISFQPFRKVTFQSVKILILLKFFITFWVIKDKYPLKHV